MTTTRTKRPPEEVGPAGRIAGLTVGACLLVSGAAFLIASWDELTCTPPGPTCDDVAGTGGAVSLVALAALLAGAAVIVMTARRPVIESGSSAWTWGLAALFAVGVGLVALRLPGHTCPSGVHLTPIFNTCVDGARRFDATSWVWPKRALFVAGLVVGVTVMRSPKRVWLTAPIAATTWLVGAGWLLYDTMITGLPR
jgi:hypothetical protein